MRWRSALGVATAWPAVYVVGYFVFAFWAFLSTAGRSRVPARVVSAQMVANALTIATVALTVGLFIVYLVIIAKDSQLDSGQKAAWMIVVLAGNVAGMLVYWYLHVSNKSQEEPGLPGVGLSLMTKRPPESDR